MNYMYLQKHRHGVGGRVEQGHHGAGGWVEQEHWGVHHVRRGVAHIMLCTCCLYHIFVATFNKIICRHLQNHYHGAGEGFEQGHKGLHHVGCGVVQIMLCTCSYPKFVTDFNKMT